ncbi:MAG TPA: HIG1 domain-containing protein [Burkholderiales bacterium]|nr:HIG1 domain-containing protein [Burkholderiales bacterium]
MDLLAVFAITGLGLAALALFNGIVSMAHGGEEDQRVSHVLMFKRVAWQALAVLFVLLALLANLR